MSDPSRSVSGLDRRQLLQTAAAAGALAVAGTGHAAVAARAATKGHIKHSLIPWCLEKYWKLDELCQVARQLGCVSVELIAPDQFPTLQKYGLDCAVANSHLFVQGMNNPRYQEGCLAMLRRRIDEAAAFGRCPTVITFTGYAEETGEWAGGANPDMRKLPPNRRVIAPEEGMRNCIAGFKQIVGYAEEKKINLAIEHLNSRVRDQGHPGYQGDHVDYVMEIIRQVGSPRLGILFDLYHVQIMDGDLIRRIRQCGEAIKHVHVAGNPGRNELDDRQEINFPPCMKALVDIGYTGYVGQEFIPTRDPLEGLIQAIKACDV